MRKSLTKFISLLLIFNLLFVGGFSAVGQVFGQSTPAPTSAPAPTSPPKEDKPPSGEKPVGVSAPADVPAPTNSVAPTSAPAPTKDPQTSVSSISPTSEPTPSENDSISPTGTESQGDSTTDEGTDGQNGSDGTSTIDAVSGSVNDPANTGTGPGSTNNATETLDQKLETLNQNLAVLQNKIDEISVSGFNYADLNTLQGQVFTGDSVASLNLLNKLNSNMTGLGGFYVFNIYNTYFGDIIFKMADGNLSPSFNSASTTVAKNSVTGPLSTNNALSDSSFTVKEANGNDAQLVNDINLQAVTGGNSASFNTGGGSIKTGDATALGNIVNLANTNLNVSQWLFGVVNIFGTLAGNIVLPEDSENTGTDFSPAVLAENSSTGPGSTNDVTYNNNSSDSFAVNNSAEITSNLDVSANSGNNSASINTGGGSVSTGLADTSITNTTVANSNTIKEEGTVWMVIVNEMGKWVGHIIGDPWGTNTASNSLPVTQTTLAENSATGPFSTNNATYNSTADTSVTSNNTASISNNITANSDTGNNKTEFNTGAGEIETGNAKTGLNLVNMVNTNVVAKKFVAVLVNVLGTFLGDVIPPEQQSQQFASNSQAANSSAASSTSDTYQIPSFNSPTANIGGLPSSNTSSDQGNSQTNLASSTTNADNYTDNNSYYFQEYEKAVYKVSGSQKKVITQSKILSKGPETKYIVMSQANNLKRGIFISPAFAKATETSFAGMLLGGATFKVNKSWLSVVPLAFLIILSRRRRRIDFTKYLNALLEIIL